MAQDQKPELLAGRGSPRAVRPNARRHLNERLDPPQPKPAVHVRFQSSRPWRPGWLWRVPDGQLDPGYPRRLRRAQEPKTDERILRLRPPVLLHLATLEKIPLYTREKGKSCVSRYAKRRRGENGSRDYHKPYPTSTEHVALVVGWSPMATTRISILDSTLDALRNSRRFDPTSTDARSVMDVADQYSAVVRTACGQLPHI